jgi:hypothetical protein
MIDCAKYHNYFLHLLQISKTKDDLYLKKPLNGGPFEKLFSEHASKYQRSEGYIAVYDD